MKNSVKKMVLKPTKYEDGSNKVKKHIISDGLGNSPLKPGMKGYDEELKRRSERLKTLQSLPEKQKQKAYDTANKAIELSKTSEQQAQETLKKATPSNNVVGERAKKTIAVTEALNKGKLNNIKTEATQNSIDEANIYKEREAKKQANADEWNKKAKGVKKMMLYKKGSKNC